MAFLMPRVAVRRQFNEIFTNTGDFQVGDLVRLASLYFVSVQAMALRLEGLSLIEKGSWEFLMESGFKPNAVKNELNLPVAQQHDDEAPYPERYKFLAVHAYQRELISEGQLAKYLRTDRITAREIVSECLTRRETQADGEDALVRLPFERSLLTHHA